MRISRYVIALALAIGVAGCQSGCAGINEAIFGPAPLVCVGGTNDGNACVTIADCPEGTACAEDTPSTPQEQANQAIAVTMELIAATTEQVTSLVLFDMISPDAGESLGNKLKAADASLQTARAEVANNALDSWSSAVSAATTVARGVVAEIARERTKSKAAGGL